MTNIAVCCSPRKRSACNYGDDIYIPAFLVGCQMTLSSFARARELDISAMLLPHWGLITGNAVQKFLSASERVTRETAEWMKF